MDEQRGQPAPEECLSRLQAGNERFRQGGGERHVTTREQLAKAAAAPQRPFAAVLACSDSRCPVEAVFDQGVGELFVVRLAGQVCSPEAIGSLEYAVTQLDTPLVVVLAHTNCGAVAAAAADEPLAGQLGALIAQLRPAVEKAGARGSLAAQPQRLASAYEANVWLSIERLLTGSAAIARQVREGKCQVVGALLELESGEVRWYGQHPLNDALKMH